MTAESKQILKANPVFAMSLGSKELFHSNFLAWVLMDSRLKEAAGNVRALLFGDDWRDASIAQIDRENVILIY